MMLYTVWDGFLDSLFCIVVVYAMLYLLTLVVRPFKFIKDKTEPQEPEIEETPAPIVKPFGIEDIQDEDMMVAALVASIDARETLKTDVVIKSVKEIK